MDHPGQTALGGRGARQVVLRLGLLEPAPHADRRVPGLGDVVGRHPRGDLDLLAARLVDERRDQRGEAAGSSRCQTPWRRHSAVSRSFSP